MRAALGGVLVLGLLSLGSHANASTTGDTKACKYTWDSMAAADKAKTNYGDYLKICLANGPTAAPTANTHPVPQKQLTQAQKQQACDSKWQAQQKIVPTGSDTKSQFIANCMAVGSGR